MTTTKDSVEFPNYIRHKSRLRIIELQMAVDIERLRADEADFLFLRTRRERQAAANRVELEVDKIRRRARNEYEIEDERFAISWYYWRASLPISLVIGHSPEEIFTRQFLALPRRICIWFVKTLGKFPYYQMGRALGYDHSTIRLAYLTVEDALADSESSYTRLLEDALIAEEEIRLGRA